MSSKLSVIKDGATRAYVGGELIYVDAAKTKQVKEIYAQKDGIRTLVWQYDITAPTLYVAQETSNIRYYLNTNAITISGSVSDTESGVADVRVNGSIVALSYSGQTATFSTTVYVNYNTRTTISVVATDNAGNKTTKYVYVYCTTSSKATTLISYQETRDTYSWSNSGTTTVPRGAKNISVSIGANAGFWWNCSGWAKVVDATTGEELKKITYSYNNSSTEYIHTYSASLGYTLEQYRSYEHNIQISWNTYVYSSGDADGILWGGPTNRCSATVDYYQ